MKRKEERESWWRMNWHYVAVRVKDIHTHTHTRTHTHTHRWMVKEMSWVQREFTNKRKGCERETRVEGRTGKWRVRETVERQWFTVEERESAFILGVSPPAVSLRTESASVRAVTTSFSQKLNRGVLWQRDRKYQNSINGCVFLCIRFRLLEFTDVFSL